VIVNESLPAKILLAIEPKSLDLYRQCLLKSDMGIYSKIKVLDLTRVISGPSCTQVFADGGATVYKIENPDGGDDSRHVPPFLGDESLTYIGYNRGKKSVAVDITKPEGSELIRQLAATCDVVVENFKAGNLKKYNLDYNSIQAVNKNIVYCSISGYGQNGPKSHLPAYDFVMQGITGLMDITGTADGTPLRHGLLICDHVTGLHATMAISSALYYRSVTGEGQFIDISMLDSALSIYGHSALGYVSVGNQQARTGNTNTSISPSDLFYCKDLPVTLMVGNQNQFKKLCVEFGRQDLIDNPLYLTNRDRVTNNQTLYQQLAFEFAKFTRDEIINKFEILGIPCGPVNNIEQVFQDPQVIHRKLVIENGHQKAIASPLRFSKTPMTYRPSPKLGEHTKEVLSTLGADLDKLKSNGVI